MLIAASVFTRHNEQLRKRWKVEAGIPTVPGQKTPSEIVTSQPVEKAPLSWEKEGYRFLPDDHLGPSLQASLEYTGTFVVYDWDTREIVWEADWGQALGNPAGFCFADGRLYVNDFEAGNIFEVGLSPEEPGRLLRRISHPCFNDLHSIERTRQGLLVASCGTDLVAEVNLDGEILWEWWAAENGYEMTPAGEFRPSGRGGEHRNIYYHTRYQSTHVNCATMQDASERWVLALLFHQGTLIQLDREQRGKQPGRVVMDGLARPHGLEKIPGGWIFCNSLGKELVVLGDDLNFRESIEYDGGWIQDSMRLPNGNLLLNDVDNTVLVELACPDWKIASRTPYNGSWRMGELAVVPAEHENVFLRGRVFGDARLSAF